MLDRPLTGLAALTVACAIALSLCGCVPVPEIPIRVATSLWPGHAPLYLARDLGYLDSSTARLSEMPSASGVISAFRSGNVDVAALTLDEAIMVAERSPDVRVMLVLASSTGADAIVARPEIRGMRGLRGKHVGVEDTALRAFMITRGLELSGMRAGDVRIVSMTIDKQEEAYRAGLIDAVVTFEPVKAKLISAGAHVIFDSSRIPGEVVEVLVARRRLLSDRSGDVAALKEAWYRALDYRRTHGSDAIRRMARIQATTPEVFQEAMKSLVVASREENERLLGGPKPALADTIARLADIMRRHGLLTQPVDPARLIGLDASGTATS